MANAVGLVVPNQGDSENRDPVRPGRRRIELAKIDDASMIEARVTELGGTTSTHDVVDEAAKAGVRFAWKYAAAVCKSSFSIRLLVFRPCREGVRSSVIGRGLARLSAERTRRPIE